MGQAMTSETLSISGGDGHRYWVGLQAKPISRGAKKTVYKGILLGSGPRQWEKVVGKAFTDMPGTRESWGHEVKKATMTKQMSIKFAEEYPSGYSIQVVIPGVVQMDKVSKVSRWQERRQGHRSLGKEDWISIEEFIPGRMYRFCPWFDEDDVMESEHLQTFSHYTYKMTDGELVACDFQGIYEDNHFIFTDSIIHSRPQTFGRFDEGEYGITEFFKRHKCTKLCSEWPVPMPLTPPPPFEDVCGGPRNKHVRFDLTPYENVVFPSQRIKPKKHKKNTGGFFHRRASYHHISRKKPSNEEETQQPNQGRLYPELPESNSTEPETRPRTFSEGALDLQRTPHIGGSLRIKTHVVLDDIPIPQRSSKRSCLKRTLSDQRGTITTPHFPSYPLNQPPTKGDQDKLCSNGSSGNSGIHHSAGKAVQNSKASDGQLENVSDKTHDKTCGKTVKLELKSIHVPGGSHHDNKSSSKIETRPESKTIQAREAGKHDKISGKTEIGRLDKTNGKTEAKSQMKEVGILDKMSSKNDQVKFHGEEGSSHCKTSSKLDAKPNVKQSDGSKTGAKLHGKEDSICDRTTGKIEQTKSHRKEGDSAKTDVKLPVKKGDGPEKACDKNEQAKSSVKESDSFDKASFKVEAKSPVKKGDSHEKSLVKAEQGQGYSHEIECHNHSKTEVKSKLGSTDVTDPAYQSDDVKKCSNLLQRRLSRDEGDSSNADDVSSGIVGLTIDLPRLEPSAPVLPE